MDDSKKERQVDNLVNLVENHTRTERHLEQYSEIGDKENKDNARDKQEVREEEIKKLKDELTNEKDVKSLDEEIGDIVDKYVSTENYIFNNVEKMPGDMLSNLGKKQENRKKQIKNLIDDNNKK